MTEPTPDTGETWLAGWWKGYEVGHQAGSRGMPSLHQPVAREGLRKALEPLLDDIEEGPGEAPRVSAIVNRIRAVLSQPETELDVERLREAEMRHGHEYDEDDHGHDCVAEVARKYVELHRVVPT